MSRKKEPCSFCEGETRNSAEDNKLQLMVEIYPENGLIGISASCINESGNFVEAELDIPMYYCPVCGRKCF